MENNEIICVKNIVKPESEVPKSQSQDQKDLGWH